MYVDSIQLITNKPVLYVCNVDEPSAVIGNNHVEDFKSSLNEENAEIMILAIGTEADINELDNFEDRQAFFNGYRIIRARVC